MHSTRGQLRFTSQGLRSMATRLRHRGIKRKRGGKVKGAGRSMEKDSGRSSRRDLAKMSVDEFFERGLASSSDSDSSDYEGTAAAAASVEKCTEKKRSQVKKGSNDQFFSSSSLNPKGGSLSQQLAKIDPDFYTYLQENDSALLEEMADSQSSLDDEEAELMEGDQSSSDDSDIGTAESRPLNVTSRKDADVVEGDGESGESDMDNDDGAQREGERVTKETIQDWMQSASGKRPSLLSLHCLCTALHDAITSLLMDTEDSGFSYFLDDPSVFNSLVVSCIKTVPLCLSHHLPRSPTASHAKTTLPSTLKGWSKVKTIVKVYLCDLLRLLEGLKEASMLCALLKHIQVMAEYYICFPKLAKRLRKVLVKSWSEGESHVRVMAFMVLRRVTLLQPHPSLHQLLKKLYLAFVSNCKFTSAKTLPQIRFMENCLVELLSIDPPTSYQHAFVYIRQLAIHLRTALTSGKKQAVQAVYNWQFIHCLDLWSHMLGHVTHDSLRPLIYPLVQVMVGALHLQPSARHYPLRLHIVRALVDLSEATMTFIPLAPYLLEIFESHGVGVAGHVTTGKPPNMAVLLHATKQQLQSSAFQSALLNEAYELMLRYFAIYSPTIGFPELAYPSLIRLRKVCKSVTFSWLRLQLKQLIEKVEAVGAEVTTQRAAVDFSPKDHHRVSAWERERRDKGNALTILLAMWVKVHKQGEQQREKASPSTRDDAAKDSESSSSSGECSDAEGSSTDAGMEEDSEDSEHAEDVVEDFRLSSEDSD